MGEYHSCVLSYSRYHFYFLVCIDEKTSLYPPSAPANAGKEGAPPSYGTEVNQPTGVVYVQAPRQVMFPLLIRKQPKFGTLQVKCVNHRAQRRHTMSLRA